MEGFLTTVWYTRLGSESRSLFWFFPAAIATGRWGVNGALSPHGYPQEPRAPAALLPS
jgi:hypothetical protein